MKKLYPIVVVSAALILFLTGGPGRALAGGYNMTPIPEIDRVGNWYGEAAAVSPDGHFLVVGAPLDSQKKYGLESGGAVFVYIRDRYGLTRIQKLLPPMPSAYYPRDDWPWFGLAVAVSDKTLVVGAPSAEDQTIGYAICYRWDGNAWVDPAILKAPSCPYPLTDASSFGCSVDVSDDGETVVVGADWLAPHGQNLPGKVYIYRFNSTWKSTKTRPWVMETAISDPLSYQWPCQGSFGYSVAISPDGTKLVVGDPDARGRSQSPNFSQGDGAAYLFEKGELNITERLPTSWQLTRTFRYPVPSCQSCNRRNDAFGESVDVTDDLLIAVGHPAYNFDTLYGGPTVQGKVHIYKPDRTGWREDEISPTPGLKYAFGCSVSLSSEKRNGVADLLAVGAPLDVTSGLRGDEGEVSIYEYGGGTWSRIMAWLSPLSWEVSHEWIDPTWESGFGGNVAISHNGKCLITGDASLPFGVGTPIFYKVEGAAYLTDLSVSPILPAAQPRFDLWREQLFE